MSPRPLTIVIKVIVLPRILRKVIERLNVSCELGMHINIPCGPAALRALVILALSLNRSFPLGYLLTRDSLAIVMAIILIRFFTMIARQKAITQMVGFLVAEQGVFGATAAAYGMPLIVELGIFLMCWWPGLIVGIYTHRLQDTFDSVDTSTLTVLEGMIETMTCELRVGDACGR